MSVRIGQPLPRPSGNEYDPSHEIETRRQIEQNFEDVYAELKRDRTGYNPDASLAGWRYRFMLEPGGIFSLADAIIDTDNTDAVAMRCELEDMNEKLERLLVQAEVITRLTLEPGDK